MTLLFFLRRIKRIFLKKIPVIDEPASFQVSVVRGNSADWRILVVLG
jgi:hypothetical protein